MNLNSDDQQFHQYQQNAQSISNHKSLKKQKRPQHMPMEIRVLVWDVHTNVTGLNWLIISKPYPLY